MRIKVNTVSIPTIGSTPDDPLLLHPGMIYTPNPDLFPPPWHVVCGTASPGFEGTGKYGALTPIMTDLANNGYLCLAFAVRSTTPLVGQTTTGRFHQQNDDMTMGIRFCRSDPGGFGYEVTGKVYGIGGSGSAYLALWAALYGTLGDDKLDGAICLSPVTDMSDRSAGVPQGFIDNVTTYGDSTDLPTLYSRSPISLDLASASPILHFNGNNENMPLTQLTRFSTEMANQGAQGYTAVTNTGALGRKHSFSMWASGVSTTAINWLNGIAT